MKHIACFSEFRAPLYKKKDFLTPTTPGKEETAISNDWNIELPSNPSAHKDYAVAAAVLGQITSARHFIEFTVLRNRLPENDGAPRWRLIACMRKIAEAERVNAEKFFELIKMDSRLGFHGEGFGYLYTPAKIRKKIKGIDQLLANELA